MRDTNVDRVMTNDPAFVSPNTSVAEARALLEYGDLHHLPVVRKGKLEGIVSSADLLKLFLLDDPAHPPAAVTVGNIMVKNPKTLPVTATLRDAAMVLTAGNFHALPVVDDDGTLKGIVTSTDLSLYLLRHLPRRDGSVREDADDPIAPGRALNDAEFVDALTALKASDENDPVARLARALLAERRPLEEVRKAAELYMRSGQAEREHGVLLKALAAARRLPATTSL